MKERPILFNGEMVRAVLDGRKTVTRRVVKPQPNLPGSLFAANINGDFYFTRYDNPFKCRYGVPGDILHAHEVMSMSDAIRADKKGNTEPLNVTMLEVVSVKVERLLAITEESAKAEGVTPILEAGDYGHYSAFNSLWWELYPDTEEPNNWDENPWVWVVEFKRIEA